MWNLVTRELPYSTKLKNIKTKNKILNVMWMQNQKSIQSIYVKKKT